MKSSWRLDSVLYVHLCSVSWDLDVCPLSWRRSHLIFTCCRETAMLSGEALAITSCPDAAPSVWWRSRKCSLHDPWPPRPLFAQTANWLGFLFSLMGTLTISVCLQTFCPPLVLRAELSVLFKKEQCGSATTAKHQALGTLQDHSGSVAPLCSWNVLAFVVRIQLAHFALFVYLY